MKKSFAYSFLGMLIALQSCKEKPVLINGAQNFIDTSYIAAVETPQLRNVLIEEFTGASCTNCPDGHEIVKSLLNSNKDRVVALAYHTFNGGSIFRPVKEPGGINSLYDFRDSTATDIGNEIFGGLTSIPAAGIDRTSFSGKLLIDKTLWSSSTNSRISVTSPVNLYITSSYNSTENKVSINVKVAYTKELAAKNSLTIGVTENDIIDLQKYPDSVAHHYDHSHVLRKFLTPYNGNTVLDTVATKKAGQVYEYNYSFTPDMSWKLENCKVFAFISNNDPADKAVLQAKEVNLK